MWVPLTFILLSWTIFLSTVESNSVIDDEQSTKSGGFRYFERDWSSTIAEIDGKSLISGGDTPTKISKMMLGKEALNNVLIIGDLGSGKTEALKKIKTELLASDPEYRVKFIDLDQIIPKDLPEDWKPETSQFGEEISKFINTPNREKVVILIDNIDRVLFNLNNKITNYFNSMTNEGIKVVSTTTANYQMVGPSAIANKIIIEIPNLRWHEIELFLTNEWNTKLGSNSPKIIDYAFATAEILKKSQIPRTLDAMKEISDLLVTGNKDVFLDENFMTVEKYVKSELSNPQELLKNLKTTKMNNFQLMNKVIGSAVEPQPIADYCGKVALQIIFARMHYSLQTSKKHLLEIQLENLRAEIKDSKFGGNLKFLRQTDKQIIFQSFLYEKFFAAKFIIDQIKGGSTSISEIAKRMLQFPKYSKVIEYINSALMEPGMPEKFQPIFESMAKNPPALSNLLDTALSFGFDEVSSWLLKNTRAPQDYMPYFQKYNGQLVEINSKSFGKYGIRFPRSEILLQHNMEKTIRLLIDVEKSSKIYSNLVWSTTEWPRYLKEFISTQEQPKLFLFEYAVENIPKKQLTPGFLNTIMYNTIKHGGFENYEILNYVKTKGARPAEINVNGETLIHMAVKDGNFEALKFVVEKLRVQITDTTQKSLLITLLDTNPTNELTPVDFWRKAQYLVGQGDLLIPSSNDPAIVDVRNLKPTPADVKSSAYKLLTRSGDRELLNEIALEIKTTPELLNELSEGVKNYRRNRILAKHKQILNVPEERLTMTEIFLEYRGPNTLSPQEQFSYEATIRSAFQHDINSNTLTPKQARNIMHGFRNNLATAEDVKFTREFFNEIAVQKEMQRARKMILSELNYLHPAEPKFRESQLRMHTLDNEFSLTRRQLHNLGKSPEESILSSKNSGAHSQAEVNKNTGNQVNPAVEKSQSNLGQCGYIF